MTDDDKPREIPEQALDTAQGGGLLDAAAGTFGVKRTGVRKAPAGTETDIKDRDDSSFASTASGSPNV